MLARKGLGREEGVSMLGVGVGVGGGGGTDGRTGVHARGVLRA